MLKPGVGLTAAMIVGLGSVSPATSTPAAVCGGELATITGTQGPDRLDGTHKSDVIYAGGGRDVVKAGRGADVVCGGRGNDRILGGRGNDRLLGGSSSDVEYRSNYQADFSGGIFGQRGDDVLRGADGMDRLEGGSGGDVLRGGADWDTALGSASIKTPGESQFWAGRLVGGGGADRLFGGSGADTLNARDGIEGNDELDGGTHAGSRDRCRSDPDPQVRCWP